MVAGGAVRNRGTQWEAMERKAGQSSVAGVATQWSMSSGHGLRGAGRSSRADPSWRSGLALGAGVWGTVAILGLWLRLGSPQPRLGDLRLLYYLAGVDAVDAYLVGGARGLLFVLHLIVSVAAGGPVSLVLLRLGVSLPRAGLIVLGLALLVQALAFLPVS